MPISYVVLCLSLWSCLTLLVYGCSADPGAEPSDRARAPSNPHEVVASSELLARLRLGEPEQLPVKVRIPVPARIEVDWSNTVLVGSPVLARVTRLPVLEGERVQRGQVVGILHSTELSAAQQAFLKALATKQLALRALERAQILLDAGVISNAEFHRREVELAEAQAELGGARDQLLNLGMSTADVERLERTRRIESALEVVAPIDGTLLRRHVTIGQVVEPGDVLFEISDLSSLWLVADVPEQYAGMLFVGQEVEAQVPSLDGRQVRGELSFVAPTVDPATRTIRVRMNLPNPQGSFKPAMMATMVLERAPAAQRVLPSSAVVREGNKEFVFVQRSPNTFVLRPVELGDEVENHRVLLGGVQPGEQVVLDGAFHLNNERRQQQFRSEGA